MPKKKKEEASNAWFSEGRIMINLIYLRFPHTYIKKQTTLCICVFFLILSIDLSINKCSLTGTL